VEKWPKYTILRLFINFQKSVIKNISLFPDTSYKKRIHVAPNKGSNILFEGNELSGGEDGNERESAYAMQAHGRRCLQRVQNLFTNSKMTLAIIVEAACIISKRSEPDINNMKENFGQIQAKLSNIENKMQENKQMLENYQQKLDAIERKLEHDKKKKKN
jgi:hypothetical protein